MAAIDRPEAGAPGGLLPRGSVRSGREFAVVRGDSPGLSQPYRRPLFLNRATRTIFEDAMRHHPISLSLALLATLALSAVGCSAPEQPAPVATPEGPAPVATGDLVAPQAYAVRVKIQPPRVGGGGAFDCDDAGLCWCIGDADCNEMFENLPCNTLNSWCNQELNKCFCDIDGGSFKDYN